MYVWVTCWGVVGCIVVGRRASILWLVLLLKIVVGFGSIFLVGFDRGWLFCFWFFGFVLWCPFFLLWILGILGYFVLVFGLLLFSFIILFLPFFVFICGHLGPVLSFFFFGFLWYCFWIFWLFLFVFCLFWI